MSDLIQGGPVLVVILALSLFAWFLVVKKFVYFSDVGSFNIKLSDKVFRFLAEGDIKQAKLLCYADRSISGRVIMEIIENNGIDRSIAKQVKQSILNREIGKLRMDLHIILLSGTVMMLLGLLGTVLGIIQTFQGMALGSASDTQFLISCGISKALLTTQAGLICAVPILVVSAYLSFIVRKRCDMIELTFKRIEGFSVKGVCNV